jgi:hypothetical protein
LFKEVFCKTLQAHCDNSWILPNAYLTTCCQSVHMLKVSPCPIWHFSKISHRILELLLSVALPVFGFIKPTVSNYLNLNIFVLSYTTQVKNQEENIHERIESPVLLHIFSLLSLILKGKKILKQVSLRGPITTRYVKR